jgi:hypothetical protein
MIDERIARVKKLIEQREKIDAELLHLFGINEPSKRGRPRKEQAGGANSETVSNGHSVSVDLSSSQSTSNGSEAE